MKTFDMENRTLADPWVGEWNGINYYRDASDEVWARHTMGPLQHAGAYNVFRLSELYGLMTAKRK